MVLAPLPSPLRKQIYVISIIANFMRTALNNEASESQQRLDLPELASNARAKTLLKLCLVGKNPCHHVAKPQSFEGRSGTTTTTRDSAPLLCAVTLCLLQ